MRIVALLRTLQGLLNTSDYDGSTDQQALAMLHEKRHPVTEDTYHTYRSLAGAVGPDVTRRLIESVNAAAASDALVDEMRHCLRGEVGLNVNNPHVAAMMTDFVRTEGLPLRASDGIAIRGLRDGLTSDADDYGLGAVTAKHIHWVRNRVR